MAVSNVTLKWQVIDFVSFAASTMVTALTPSNGMIWFNLSIQRLNETFQLMIIVNNRSNLTKPTILTCNVQMSKKGAADHGFVHLSSTAISLEASSATCNFPALKMVPETLQFTVNLAIYHCVAITPAFLSATYMAPEHKTKSVPVTIDTSNKYAMAIIPFLNGILYMNIKRTSYGTFLNTTVLNTETTPYRLISKVLITKNGTQCYTNTTDIDEMVVSYNTSIIPQHLDTNTVNGMFSFIIELYIKATCANTCHH